MKLHLLFVLFFSGLAWFVLSSRSGGLANVANQDRSGSPVSTGQCSNCHSGGSFGVQAAISVRDGNGNTVNSYIPGDTYTIEIALSSTSGTPEYGSQLSILDANNNMAGTFGSTLTPNTQISSLPSRSVLEHSGRSSTGIFQANWTAPSSGTGTITLYGNGVAVDGTGSTANDEGSSVVSLSLTEASTTTISYGQSSYCTDEIDPTPTISGTTGGSFASSIGISLDPNSGTIDLDASIPGNYTITYTYSGGSTSSSVTINEPDQATITYPSGNYCANDAASVSPSVAGTGGGTFSSSPGLSINALTGEIDLSNSLSGLYTITYSTSGPCPTTTSTTFSIAPSSDASFSYNATSFCISDPNNPIPTISGNTGGTFSSSAGGALDINSSTGEIDLSISNPGNYDITYIVGTSCPDTQVINIDITTAGDASFNYNNNLYCSDDGPELPDFITTLGGTFSASSPDLSLNPNTGEIDPTNSLEGVYDISYVVGTGNCRDSQSISIEIVLTDSAGLSYDNTIYCLNAASNPIPTTSGESGGTFASTPNTGISINSSTGEIDLANSQAGIYTIEYRTTSVCPNTAFFELELQVCGGLHSDLANQLNIYPNPSTSGIFHLTAVEFAEVEGYQLYNAMGQEIEGGKWNNRAELDLSNQHKGFYLLQLYSKGKVYNYKLLYQ